MKPTHARLFLSVLAGLSATALLSNALATETAKSPASAPPSVGVVVTPAAIAAVAGKVPPAKASTTRKAGTGELDLNVANNEADEDSMWDEKVDMDGDGGVEDTSLVLDDDDNVQYASSTGTFSCLDGSTAEGDMTIAVNGAGNPRGRPAGSGFWAVSLDKDECGAKARGLVGCRFNAAGESTECGAVTIDAENDDIVIVDPAD